MRLPLLFLRALLWLLAVEQWTGHDLESCLGDRNECLDGLFFGWRARILLGMPPPALTFLVLPAWAVVIAAAVAFLLGRTEPWGLFHLGPKP
jgi:hypothetical protein